MPLWHVVLYQSKVRSQLSHSHLTLAPSKYQVTTNPITGKTERIFADLFAVYISPEDPGAELSFEEIWAANRGWLNRNWDDERAVDYPGIDQNRHVAPKTTARHEVVQLDENGCIPDQSREGRSKKKKVMSVNETQISKSSLMRLRGVSKTII